MNSTTSQLSESHVARPQWHYDSLKGQVSIAHGFAFKSQYFTSAGDYKLMTPGHFYEEGGFRPLGDKQKYYLGPIPDAYVFAPGDLVVAMTEQADGLLGSAALVPDDGRYLHNQRLGRIKVLSASIDLRFLYYVFNSSAYRRSVQETAAGTKVKHTSPAKLLEIVVPLPSLTEQRAIASTLSDVDALIGALDKLIAKKRAIKLATMQQLLTGKTRLPGFRGEWGEQPLGNLVELIPSGIYGQETGNDQVEPMPVATTAHIDSNDTWNGKAMAVRYFSKQQIEQYAPREGDLIVVKSSGSAASIQSGKIGFVSKELAGSFIFSNFLMLLRAVRCKSRFLYYQLVSDRVKRMLPNLVEASTYPNLRINDYLEVLLPIPDEAEQEAITLALSDMDAEITALERQRDKTKAIKQGMMQSLLTGRVRLVEPEEGTP